MKLDLIEIENLIINNYLMRQKHPIHDIWIYNYTSKCQYERYWNELTLICRGLVLDAEGNIIARSFAKFFNYEELTEDQIPKEEYIITAKMDGSLILCFKYKDETIFASRGSFTSDQAKWASELMTDHSKELIPEGITFVLELIHKNNRIVCDYGDVNKLVLLAMIKTEDGAEKHLTHLYLASHFFHLEPVKYYTDLQYQDLKSIIKDNEEGFVIQFYPSLFRMKIKGEEYIRLHRIVTCVSTTIIWEYLSQGLSFDDLLEKVPDEFFNWVKKVKNELQYNYVIIQEEANKIFDNYNEKFNYNLPERAEFAKLVKLEPKHLQPILFKMYDNKDCHNLIWKLIKPKYEKAFSI